MKEEELRCLLKLEKENNELVKKVKIGIKRLLNQNDQKDKEIERLNNIIDELEDKIVIKLQRNYHESNYRINTGDLEELYDKLKELKNK